MNRVLAVAMCVVVALGVADCTGSNGVEVIPLGGLVLETIDGVERVRVRARVGYEDPPGIKSPVPAEGAIVIIGGRTPVVAGAGVGPAQRDVDVGWAVSTNDQGAIDTVIMGLSLQSGVPIRIAAPGFLPLLLVVPPGTTFLPADTLILRPDPNPADNPKIQNARFQRGGDGILRFTGTVPEGCDVVVFSTADAIAGIRALSMLSGVNGPVYRTVIGPDGPGLSNFSTEMPDTIPAGRWFAYALDEDSGTDLTMVRTCRLSLADYRRTGNQIAGTIRGPSGAPAAGAGVLVFEDGSPGSRSGVTTGADGGFSLGFRAMAVGSPITMQVEWIDPVTGDWYLCVWRGFGSAVPFGC